MRDDLETDGRCIPVPWDTTVRGRDRHHGRYGTSHGGGLEGASLPPFGARAIFGELPDGHKQLRSRARLSRSYDSPSP